MLVEWAKAEVTDTQELSLPGTLCFTITHAESFVLLQMDSNASSSYMHSQAREQASYLLHCYFFISPGPI